MNIRDLAGSCRRIHRTRIRLPRAARSEPGTSRKNASPSRSAGKRAKRYRRQLP